MHFQHAYLLYNNIMTWFYQNRLIYFYGINYYKCTLVFIRSYYNIRLQLQVCLSTEHNESIIIYLIIILNYNKCIHACACGIILLLKVIGFVIWIVRVTHISISDNIIIFDNRTYIYLYEYIIICRYMHYTE